MPKPLIVYITSFYPTESRPHHGIFFQDHAKALSLEADVAVLHAEVPSWRQARRRKPEARTRYDDDVFVWMGSYPVVSHRFSNRILRAERNAVFQGLQSIQREFGRLPDFIIAQNVLPPGRWAKYIYEQFGVPFGTIEHFTFLEQMLKEQYEEIEAIYSRASFIAGVSHSVKDLLIGYLPQSIHQRIGVIGNVLGPEFQHAELTLADPEPFHWLFVGPDTFKKGPELLYEVFSGLERSDWKLTIAGTGRFESFASDERLRNNVSFTSGLTRPEMVQLMKHHDALISTSHIETFGMAILEMMALGRPVVATRSGGPQDFVDDQCGILTQVGRADELRGAVHHIQDHYRDYSARTIRDYAIQSYGQRVYARRILSLIEVFG